MRQSSKAAQAFPVSKAGADSDFDTEHATGVWPVHSELPACLREDVGKKRKRTKPGFGSVHHGHVNLTFGKREDAAQQKEMRDKWFADKSQFPRSTQPLPKARVSFERWRR